MEKQQTYTRYHLHDSNSQETDFALLYMPDFLGQHCGNPHHAHIHSFYQIIWFKKGHGKHYVDFKEYPVEDNTLFFISPGQIHWFEENKSFEGLIIHFNESFLSDENQSETAFLKYNMFNSFDADPYFKVCEKCEQKIETIAQQLDSELQNKNSFAHSDYMKFLVKMFLIEVQRMGRRGLNEEMLITDNGNRIFVKFRQALEHHYKDMHTVKEYADFLNVSTKSLTNYVQQSAHLTPLKMINDRIILEAKRLLQHSSMKVKEITFYLGFEDPSYFVKFFKRQVGILPVEFRDMEIE
ncbi:MAG: helix-turn-helix domain-containing protein [Bacteroidales bacterium]|jgi:AraC-like DNA-binding protein/mannose-6-phosphate isomerase-like protein (cupin superfamily)|nr:helix-turn-helix domain-containing protein [Bacteroidales bacterium]